MRDGSHLLNRVVSEFEGLADQSRGIGLTSHLQLRKINLKSSEKLTHAVVEFACNAAALRVLQLQNSGAHQPVRVGIGPDSLLRVFGSGNLGKQKPKVVGQHD